MEDHFAAGDRSAAGDRYEAADRRVAADRSAVVVRFAQVAHFAEVDRYEAAVRMLAARPSVEDLTPQARLYVTPGPAVATIPRFVRALPVATLCPAWQAWWALHLEHQREHAPLWMERGSAAG